MKGLELARKYYDQVGYPALAHNVPDLLPRMAIGLAGEGSECFGFDDVLSHDHDWGAGFCIWLDEQDFVRFGAQAQAVYDSLPTDGFVVRKSSPYARQRVGCLCTQHWYRRYTGEPDGPRTLSAWRRIPEAFLATAVNGAVFYDPMGHFSAVRDILLQYYPEDIRLKKIAARAAVIAQAGQYNYPRCCKRGDMVAARLALDEWLRAAMSMVYLLNWRYAPFYKWMHRGLYGLPRLPQAYDQFARVIRLEDGMQTTDEIEGICITIAAELRRQGLSDSSDSFLQAHCDQIMNRIRDPDLRRTHIMEE